MTKRLVTLFVALLWGLSAVATADIPYFWLDKPTGRNNKFDPKSPLFIQATNTPLPTPFGGSSYTPTPTASPTRTATLVLTATPSQSPGGPSNTPSPTLTTSPTRSATRTATPSPTTAVASPTLTATRTPTTAPTCAPTPDIVINNFDLGAGSAFGTYMYNGASDGSQPNKVYWDPANAPGYTTGYCSANALSVTVESMGSYGFGFGFSAASGTLDVSTATAFRMAIKVTAPTDLYITLTEGAGGALHKFQYHTPAPITATGGWQIITIPVGQFVDKNNGDIAWVPAGGDAIDAMDIQFNNNGDGNPATTGDGDPNQVFFDEIGFLTGALPATNTPTPTNPPTDTPTPTWTPTPTPTFTTGVSCGLPCGTCIKYEDFEAPVTGDYHYEEFAGDAASMTTTTAEAHTCLQALAVTMNNTGSNYAAAGFGSNFYTADVVNASGANYLNLWMKAATGFTFAVSFVENFGTPTDPQNEGWTSSSQSYTATGTWQQFHIPLTAFSENIYNGVCTGQPGGCVGSQNNTMDLDKVGAMDINFTTKPYTGVIYVDDISFDTAMPTPTPTPAAPPVSFNDFEDGAACGSYRYADGDTPPADSTFTQAVTGTSAHTGGYGWELTTDTTGPNFAWGGGAGTQPPGCANVDATGRNNVTFWIKADKASGSATSIGYYLTLVEGHVTPAPDPTNESWAPPSQTLSTFGSWVKVSIPLGSFSEKTNNWQCSPNCGTAGNNTLDLDAMSTFDFNINTAGFNGTISIDDIMFE